MALPQATPRKADRVARDLLSRIVSGELAVGSLLPKEDELAARYKVNRSVVREAIKLLEVHRLVRPVRRRGTEVLSPLASMSPEVLRAMLSPRPHVVDRHVLAGILEIRAALDVQMVGLAAERRTKVDLTSMDAALARLGAALEERAGAPAYFAAADELSLAMARATKNPLFEMLAAWNRMVVTDLDELFALVRAPGEPHLAALRLVIDRIRERDVENARKLVRTYHEWATPRLLAAAAPPRAGEALEKLMEKLR
jgi:GntR family transcriptional repressor for pyruvate dehydrogenase complex